MGEFGHTLLAQMHGINNFKGSETEVRYLATHEKIGNYTNSLAAVFENRIGNNTHEAHIAASIYKGVTFSGEVLAQCLRCLRIYGIDSGCRAAEDADIHTE
jgi:hypothetical protein